MVKKLGISFISLVLTLAVVEVGLRAAGSIVQKYHEQEHIPEFDEPNTRDNDTTYEHFTAGNEAVMCIGDSFTNGGNVQSYDTYPYFLYKKLNSGSKKISVLNYGKCESTTFEALERIQQYLSDLKSAGYPKPKYISLLVGSADMFGESFGPVNDRTISAVDMGISSFYKSFRLYKIYRILKYEYFRRFGFSDRLRIPYTKVSQRELIATHYIFENAREIFTKSSEPDYAMGTPEFAKLSDNLPEEYSKSWFNEVLPKESLPGKVYLERITMYLSSIYARKNKHTEIIKLLVNLMRKYPTYFWQEDYLKALRYNLIQSLKLQSQYVPSDILNILIQLETSNPALSKNQTLQDFKDVITNWDRYMKELDLKRSLAWRDIVELAETENIQLILQTYPSGYTSTNSMIRRVAKKYSLPLVDNNLIFQPLIQRDGREKYLFDDDHCTPEGYKIIAENVFETIKSL